MNKAPNTIFFLVVKEVLGGWTEISLEPTLPLAKNNLHTIPHRYIWGVTCFEPLHAYSLEFKNRYILLSKIKIKPRKYLLY